MSELSPLIELISKGGLAIVSILIFYGGYKRMWVWGYQLADMERDRDQWRDLALKGTNLATRAVATLEQK